MTGYERLLTLGGFPEPFIGADEREARRWRRERFDRILREDVRDLESIRDIQLLALFTDALRERVSGILAISNLAKDLQISPKTAKKLHQRAFHIREQAIIRGGDKNQRYYRFF